MGVVLEGVYFVLEGVVKVALEVCAFHMILLCLRFGDL